MSSSDDAESDSSSGDHTHSSSDNEPQAPDDTIGDTAAMSDDGDIALSTGITPCQDEAMGEEGEAMEQDSEASKEDSDKSGSNYEHESNDSSQSVTQEDEEEQQSTASGDEATTSEQSDDGEGAVPIPKKRRTSGRLSEDTIKFMENENILRRSGRQRKEVLKKTEPDSDSSMHKTKKKGKKRLMTSSDSESSDDVSSDEEMPKRRVNKRKTKPILVRKKRKQETSDDDGDDDYSDDVTRSSARRKPSKGTKKTRINYKDISSNEEFNSSDVLEWEENEPVDPSTLLDHNTTGTETIEKVLKHRAGYPGATGSGTTCYNVEDKGDPNVRPTDEEKPLELERQFLIKWLGWSHLHNTWESENSLMAVNTKGMKKVDNYLKKLREIDDWKQTADKEYIEFYDCEREMHEELFDQYKVVERIIAHQVSREKGEVEGLEYYVKWTGLPYSECTWEDEHLIGRKYQDHIDSYHERRENAKIPNKNCPVMRRRPKFCKVDVMTDRMLQRRDKDQELRDYQLESVNWMLHAWTKENSCILADEMGLGKTIQSIAFLSVLYHEYQLYGPFLVVVPLSTMAAWQREFHIWASDINVVTYMGDVTSRDYIRQFEMFVLGTKRLKMNVLLTTYEILLKDKAFLGGFEWAVLAVDEAHRLKNDESLLYRSLADFSTNHRLLITGTPLQNSLKELWALLHFIMPNKFESWADFEEDHHDPDHRAIASLHRKLEPFLLRRVKKDVEKSLPAKVEQILRVDMTIQQKQFYKWILTKNYKELSKGVKGSINGFCNLIMELKKCCNHASLVRAYDYYEEGAQARLQQLLKSSGKLILLDKLLCRLHETGHRVLIFSQMVMMLDILEEYLQLRRFPSQRLDGSMRADLRKAALDHFNADGSSDFCFLLSTRAGGLGINLATADTVIIFDSDWNPQNDLQAMSRAHRIGQKKQVNIYRLVTKASVEEEIVERAKRKLVLDHLVIQRMDTTGRTVLSRGQVANGSVPFDKQELAVILKFGAEELFKEKEGDEVEPEVDIDNILQGAETRECEQHETGSELLSAFKYANFAFDEENDVATLNKMDVGGSTRDGQQKDWDDIIPEDERKKVEEEEREKAEKDLFLGPRNRNKVPNMADDYESEGEEGGKKRRKRSPGDDDDDSDDDRPKRGKKKLFFGFTEAEIRKFVKSFRKFASPLTRLEAIAQDAELEEHSKGELEQLGKELLTGCTNAQTEYDNTVKEPEKKVGEDGRRKHDRGPMFKLGTVDVYVRPLLKMQADLEPLSGIVPEGGDTKDLKIPGIPKEQKGWDVEWEMEDDVALLRGVHRYGLGSWEAVKMDPDYGLVEKIWLKDKNKKPQAKHLQARAEFLLKYLAKYTKSKAPKTARQHKKPKKTSPTADGGKNSTGKEERKRKREPKAVVEEKPDDRRREHKAKASKEKGGIKLETLSINKSKYTKDIENKSSTQFSECVQVMRPAQKYLRKLVNCKDLSSTESLKYLLKVGDQLMEHVEKLSTSKSLSHVEKWHSYLWIFVSRFTNHEPNDLLNKYRIATKNRAEQEINPSHHKHHHHHKRADTKPSLGSNIGDRKGNFGNENRFSDSRTSTPSFDREDRRFGTTTSTSQRQQNDYSSPANQRPNFGNGGGNNGGGPTNAATNYGGGNSSRQRSQSPTNSRDSYRRQQQNQGGGGGFNRYPGEGRFNSAPRPGGGGGGSYHDRRDQGWNDRNQYRARDRTGGEEGSYRDRGRPRDDQGGYRNRDDSGPPPYRGGDRDNRGGQWNSRGGGGGNPPGNRYASGGSYGDRYTSPQKYPPPTQYGSSSFSQPSQSSNFPGNDPRVSSDPRTMGSNATNQDGGGGSYNRTPSTNAGKDESGR